MFKLINDKENITKQLKEQDTLIDKLKQEVKDKETEIVQALNKVIKEAIIHGGDSGGAYFSNNAGLMNSVKDLLSVLNLDNEFTVNAIDDYDSYADYYDAIVPLRRNE